MKQIKVIFKSGADITIWVEDYAWVDQLRYFRVYPAEGHPSVPYINTAEIAAVLELT